MKKIKIIVSFVLIFVLIFGIYKLVKKPEYNYYLALGDYVSNDQLLGEQKVNSFTTYLGNYLVSSKKVNESANGYISNNLTSKKLLGMIENDVTSVHEGKIKDKIKKSKYITITVGINDVINQIKYDTLKEKLVYDKETISNKIEVFKHNYHQIVEEIEDINENAKVILVGYYPIYGDLELTNNLNNAIEEVAISTNSSYVSLIDMKDKYWLLDNELYLTNSGQEEISKRVINLISGL